MRLCSCNAVLVWQMIFRCWRTPLVFLNCFDVFVASPPPFTFSIFTISPPFFPPALFKIPWLPKKLLAVGFPFFFFCTCFCVSQSFLFFRLWHSYIWPYFVLFSLHTSQSERKYVKKWRTKAKTFVNFTIFFDSLVFSLLELSEINSLTYSEILISCWQKNVLSKSLIYFLNDMMALNHLKKKLLFLHKNKLWEIGFQSYWRKWKAIFTIFRWENWDSFKIIIGNYYKTVTSTIKI